MQIGLGPMMQSCGDDGITDTQVFDEEVQNTVLADELGYDLVSKANVALRTMRCTRIISFISRTSPRQRGASIC